MYSWLMKNGFRVVFDDTEELAGANLLSWAENQVKQVKNFPSIYLMLFRQKCMFCGCQQIVTLSQSSVS